MSKFAWFQNKLLEIDVSMNQLTNIDFLDDYQKL